MTKKEYHQILFQLGLLDSEEDWELYQKQELKYPVDDCYNKYSLESVVKPLYNNRLNSI